MDKKNIIIIVAIGLVIGAVAFFGGMKFAQGKDSQNALAQRQQRMGAGFGGQGAGGQRSGGRGAGGFVNGEVISKDDKSVTLKLRDGGSKIVYFASSTEISKFAKGEVADLENGKTIMVNGSTNSDGSVVAQSIQIRPSDLMSPPTSTH